MTNLSDYKQKLLENYDFETERVIKEINKNKVLENQRFSGRQKSKRIFKRKIICLQFPEGLKAIAPQIATEIEQKTKCHVLIWIDSCFGACDTPLGLDKLGVDMLIQYGHAPWTERNK